MRKSLFCVTLIAIMLTMFTLTACGDNGGVENDPPDTISFEFVSADITTAVGSATKLSWTTNSKEAVTFSASGDCVSVSESGDVTALKEGSSIVVGTVEGVSDNINIIVIEPANGVIKDGNIEYSFSVPASGLYEIKISTGQNDLTVAQFDDNITFAFDDSYSTRLKSRGVDGTKILIGTKYFLSGSHKMYIKNGGSLLPTTKIEVISTQVYDSDRLSLAKIWMDELYVETGVDIDKPNYLGYYETKGWDDIWTHCQYLPYSMYIASAEDNDGYRQRTQKIADDFLIDRMLTESGGVYTVYQSNEDVYQVSIEPDMPTNKFELWRGNTSFAEEMINCYKYFGDEKYLGYAKKAMDYVMSTWSKTMVEGGLTSYYTRYSGSNGGAIETMSTGRAVMVLSQLYLVTNETKYKAAAEAQAKALLKAQETKYPNIEGLFSPYVAANGSLDEFRHGNAYANAMLGLSWVYKITGKQIYLDAIDKGVKVLKTVYDDELGMIIVNNGSLYPTNPSTGPAYMAGRIGQSVMTAAYFTGNIEYYREGERVLEFVMGRNVNNRDLQNTENGWYYYTVDYTGMSNIETSGEIYLAQIQYYYLDQIWGI